MTNNRFEWVPEISVGNDVIDAQHIELLSQINKLFGVVEGEVNVDMIGDTISFLDAYIYNHFSYEEEYMREHDYPEIEEHIRIHEDFAERYDKFKAQLESQGPGNDLAHEVAEFLGNWFIEHIRRADKKYALWIEEHEVSER